MGRSGYSGTRFRGVLPIDDLASIASRGAHRAHGLGLGLGSGAVRLSPGRLASGGSASSPHGPNRLATTRAPLAHPGPSRRRFRVDRRDAHAPAVRARLASLARSCPAGALRQLPASIGTVRSGVDQVDRAHAVRAAAGQAARRKYHSRSRKPYRTTGASGHGARPRNRPRCVGRGRSEAAGAWRASPWRPPSAISSRNAQLLFPMGIKDFWTIVDAKVRHRLDWEGRQEIERAHV